MKPTIWAHETGSPACDSDDSSGLSSIGSIVARTVFCQDNVG
jgi:hypothetical protein